MSQECEGRFSARLTEDLAGRLRQVPTSGSAEAVEDEPELDLGVFGEIALKRWVGQKLVEHVTGRPAEFDPIADWGIKNLIARAREQ
jgi:hypothetical protein